MPLTKRLKDAIHTYQVLQKDLRQATDVLISAQSTHRKAEEALTSKIHEILKELDNCVIAPSSFLPELVIEIDGKVYLINPTPKDMDMNTRLPTYIREITVEK